MHDIGYIKFILRQKMFDDGIINKIESMNCRIDRHKGIIILRNTVICRMPDGGTMWYYKEHLQP